MNLSPSYRSQSVDTHPEADYYQFKRWRQLSLTQRLQMAAQLIRTSKTLGRHLEVLEDELQT